MLEYGVGRDLGDQAPDQLTWIRWGSVIVIPNTRIGYPALWQRRTAHSRYRGTRNWRWSAARRTVRTTAWSAPTAWAATSAGSATATTGGSCRGGAAHPLVVHSHRHVGIAEREGRRPAGWEREAQASGTALACGPWTLVLQPVALHAVAGGIHDAASQLTTAASARLQGKICQISRS